MALTGLEGDFAVKITKLGATLAVSALACAALALPTFVTPFDSTYHLMKNPNLKKAACGVCHIGMAKTLNPYGLDLKKALEAKHTKMITAEILKSVENLDSDKDGVKNGVELRADSLPGDPKSKPAHK